MNPQIRAIHARSNPLKSQSTTTRSPGARSPCRAFSPSFAKKERDSRRNHNGGGIIVLQSTLFCSRQGYVYVHPRKTTKLNLYPHYPHLYYAVPSHVGSMPLFHHHQPSTAAVQPTARHSVEWLAKERLPRFPQPLSTAAVGEFPLQTSETPAE